MGNRNKRAVAGALAIAGLLLLMMGGGMSDGGIELGAGSVVALIGLALLTAGVWIHNEVTGGVIDDKWEVTGNDELDG